MLYGEPPIRKGGELDRDVKASFIELLHLISSKDIPGIGRPEKFDVTLERITDDIPENYLLMLKYMMKNPIIRKGIFQFFPLFLKPLIDNHPELSEEGE